LGKLLGDPAVWDDALPRPRPLLRGLVGLAAGLAAGALVAAVATPRPAPRPAPVTVPAAAETPRVPLDQQTIASISLSAGPMVLRRASGLEAVEPDGTGHRLLAADVDASAIVAGPGGSLVALDHGQLTRVTRDGTARRLGPRGFVAGGLAGRGDQLLACADSARAPGQGLLLAAGGHARPVRLGCPVAWAAGADLAAGAGGPWRRLALPAAAGPAAWGASVLAGPPGAPRVLLDPARLRAEAGPGAVVAGLALSPDGRLAAVAAGAPGRPWTVLVVPARPGAGGVTRIPLADGYQPAWLGWAARPGTVTLAVAALDRRGELARVDLDSRMGDGYLLTWDPAARSARVLVAGAPLVAADGFAWSGDGETVGISSPAGVTLALQVDQVYVTAAKASGTLVGWLPESAP
jgi:hypothetical protein